jgi:predicted RNA-binding protein with TRAM domain
MCSINAATIGPIEVNYMFGDNDRVAPVNAGQQYDVKIEDIAKQGDGIARIQGFIIFVPGTKVGDEVKIEVQAVKRNFAVASIVQ